MIVEPSELIIGNETEANPEIFLFLFSSIQSCHGYYQAVRDLAL